MESKLKSVKVTETTRATSNLLRELAEKVELCDEFRARVDTVLIEAEIKQQILQTQIRE